MRPTDMHQLAHQGCHEDCSPKGWHDVPKVTGDYDFDATIEHRKNPAIPQRLELYLRRTGPLTGYNAYHNYRGDS